MGRVCVCVCVCARVGRTYVQLLIIARPLLASSLELLAHGADLLVGPVVFGACHFGTAHLVSLLLPFCLISRRTCVYNLLGKEM
jgi:hypothetical protein